jgi:aryl-alcohol dehydrogenase-like predicted oxidoreductase
MISGKIMAESHINPLIAGAFCKHPQTIEAL